MASISHVLKQNVAYDVYFREQFYEKKNIKLLH